MYKLMDFLTDSLTPTDTQMGELAAAEWWQYVKPNFDDEIWQYYFDRIVFVNAKFPEDNDEVTYQNVIRSFVINLKTKKRQYERLYNVLMEDYNPLWNVDGVTGIVNQADHTGTDARSKSGYDTSTLSGSDVSTLSGRDVDTLSGSDTEAGSRDDTTTNTISKDDTTKTGNEVIASSGSDTDTKAVATFDSAGNIGNSERDTLAHGKSDTHTYNNVKDAHEFSGTTVLDSDDIKTMTYGKIDTMAYGKTDTMSYGKSDRMDYHSTDTETRNLQDKFMEMQIRQGNIGVTMSQQLLNAELESWQSARADFIKLVVRECVNTCTYAVEGI